MGAAGHPDHRDGQVLGSPRERHEPRPAARIPAHRQHAGGSLRRDRQDLRRARRHTGAALERFQPRRERDNLVRRADFGQHDAVGASAHDGTGLDEVQRRLTTALDDADARDAAAPAPEAIRVHRFDPLAEGWEIVAEADNSLRVHGRRVETAAARTNFENPESRDRFWRLLERLGIDEALRAHGAEPGTTVHIGGAELEWGDE